jgi:hypothetical protein
MILDAPGVAAKAGPIGAAIVIAMNAVVSPAPLRIVSLTLSILRELIGHDCLTAGTAKSSWSNQIACVSAHSSGSTSTPS